MGERGGAKKGKGKRKRKEKIYVKSITISIIQGKIMTKWNSSAALFILPINQKAYLAINFGLVEKKLKIERWLQLVFALLRSPQTLLLVDITNSIHL